jgi:hypothetical protein
MPNHEQTPAQPNFEQTIETLKHERFMFAHFIDGILSGEFKKLPKKQVKKMVEDHFFSFEPLSPLDDAQESLLGSAITEHLSHTLNGDSLRHLCRDVFFDGKRAYFGRVSKDELQEKNCRKLSSDEKIALFF